MLDMKPVFIKNKLTIYFKIKYNGKNSVQLKFLLLISVFIMMIIQKMAIDYSIIFKYLKKELGGTRNEKHN